MKIKVYNEKGEKGKEQKKKNLRNLLHICKMRHLEVIGLHLGKRMKMTMSA